MPGMTWEGDVAGLGAAGHAAWFKDSEDNVLYVLYVLCVLCVDDTVPA